MKLLDLTLASLAANVALDEALLESAGQSESHDDVLRFWEPPTLGVVLGRSSVVASEVNIDYCRREGIPIVRRCSGGAAIVTGPGCLMYAVVLSLRRWPQLELLDAAHRAVLQRNSKALATLGIDAQPRGTSDLAVRERKISGNSMRRGREWILYHGTFLYEFSLGRIEACLRQAPRQPEYRRGRGHSDFVVNLSTSSSDLKRALIAAWNSGETLSEWPEAQTTRLLEKRYRSDEWNWGLSAPRPEFDRDVD